jgi:addiction module HigA family antidote
MRIRTHPGEALREELMKPHGLTAHRLSLLLRVSANRICAIVKEDRAVSSDSALRLARLFGTTPELWLNLQRAHDLSVARENAGREIEREVQPLPAA